MTRIWNCIDSVLGILLPKYCAICGKRLYTGEEVICSHCTVGHRIEPVFGRHDDNRMVRLLMGQFDIQKGNSMFRFVPHGGASEIIYKLKYQRHPDVGYVMGEYAAEALEKSGFFDGIDIIIPVPLSPKRLKERGFNQSEAIACGISRHTGIEISTTAVVRTGFKSSQTHLNRWERKENVSEMFKVADPKALCGKHILLIDDVFTTGATMISCGRAIQESGEDTVISVFTLGFAGKL